MSTESATVHEFQTKPSAARTREKGVFFLFRAATYFVLLCGALVFGTIIYKGAGTIFTTRPPSANRCVMTCGWFTPESSVWM